MASEVVHTGLYNETRRRYNMCHGSSLDDDKAPATTPVATPAATPAATSIAKLPTVGIGKHDLSFEAHSMQDLDALADAELLRDVRGKGGETRQKKRG